MAWSVCARPHILQVTEASGNIVVSAGGFSATRTSWNNNSGHTSPVTFMFFLQMCQRKWRKKLQQLFGVFLSVAETPASSWTTLPWVTHLRNIAKKTFAKRQPNQPT